MLSSDHLDLKPELDKLRHSLRPGQRELADWRGGPLAISAVPGSGKSYGMAVAAAIALARNGLQRSHQLVIVTFTRSAAANLKQQIHQHLQALQVFPGGFTVQTLHGLALNIASRHPQLSGLNLGETTLISPNRQHRLMRRCVDQWAAAQPRLYQLLMEQGAFDGEETERLRRQSVLRTEVLPGLADIAIREAKSSGLAPQNLYALSEQTVDEVPVLAIAAGLYQHYQQALHSHRFIDYDDMILAALKVLADDQARRLWQTQVFAVFEDEAQDSTPLQTQLLEILAATPDPPEHSNLVRVGDPNQAINSTFTPADPSYFRRFCATSDTLGRLATLHQSGRSSPVILESANFVVRWVNQSGLAGSVIPFREQAIKPVPPTDPQADANPDPEGAGVEIHHPRDIFETVKWIGQRVIDLLSAQPQARAAVLVRENKQGRFISEVLSQPDRYGIQLNWPAERIEIFDVGTRDRRSHVPAELLALLRFLARPHSPDYLKAALAILVDRQLLPVQDLNRLASQPEQFLYPGPLNPPQSESEGRARDLGRQLLRAHWELPHFQLIPFLALTLRYDATELATADKLNHRLVQQTAGRIAMADILPVLQDIVSAERFEPVEVEATEDQYLRSSQLTIITMHKAKGLDWDYVFVPFLHESMIPGKLWVPGQAKFLGDFTLAEVARAQIRASLQGRSPLPSIAEAWQRASDLKIAEEFRLLYVAMTRAKRLLWLSAAKEAPFNWHTFDWLRGHTLESQTPCPVLPALREIFHA